jgi:hypothetical protein
MLQTFWSGKGYFSRPAPPTVSRPNKKRDDNYERRGNDVVKHEASRMASSATVERSSKFLVSLLAAVLALWRTGRQL